MRRGIAAFASIGFRTYAKPRHSADAPSSTAYAASETASGANPSSMFAAMPPNDMMPNAMAMRRDE